MNRWYRISFLDVKLEQGIGLLQAQGIDDYASEEECQKLRAQDEKSDWKNIAIEKLNQCSSSLCFFDAKGMRFQLPAFMIADIKDQYEHGMAFTLTHLSDYSMNQFEELNKTQIKAVIAFLEYMLENEEYQFEGSQIQQALSGFWLNRLYC